MAGGSGVRVQVVYDNIPKVPALARAAVAAQVRRSTYEVEAEAKRLAPVRTGTLRRSIHSVFSEDGLRGVCGPSVDYAIYVEFGTRHTSARPYMRPAAHLVLPRFATEITRILGRLRLPFGGSP